LTDRNLELVDRALDVALLVLKVALQFLALALGAGFGIVRFLLGVAEAGFFPGVILYLTYWFPARYRARIISRFMLAIPLSLAVGAPLSTWIMQLDGVLGYHGWQWLFIIEGIPTALATFVVLKWLPDRPSDATWLNEDEKRWLENELISDRELVAVDKGVSTIREVFTNPIVWSFCLIYLAATTCNLGLSMFLPQIIKQQGFSMMQTGFIMSIPYIAGCAGMLAIGYSSDHFKERKWHLAGSLGLVTIGLGLAGFLGNTIGAIVAICCATIGIMGCKGPFWPLPSAYLSGAGAAAGIALVNAVGNLGGFFGPWVVGIAKQTTNSFSGGLYALALVALIGTLLTIITVKVRKQQVGVINEKTPGGF